VFQEELRGGAQRSTHLLIGYMGGNEKPA